MQVSSGTKLPRAWNGGPVCKNSHNQSGRGCVNPHNNTTDTFMRAGPREPSPTKTEADGNGSILLNPVQTSFGDHRRTRGSWVQPPPCQGVIRRRRWIKMRPQRMTTKKDKHKTKKGKDERQQAELNLTFYRGQKWQWTSRKSRKTGFGDSPDKNVRHWC